MNPLSLQHKHAVRRRVWPHVRILPSRGSCCGASSPSSFCSRFGRRGEVGQLFMVLRVFLLVLFLHNPSHAFSPVWHKNRMLLDHHEMTIHTSSTTCNTLQKVESQQQCRSRKNSSSTTSSNISIETTTTFSSPYPPRHPIFESTNVVTKSFQIPKTSFIQKIAPFTKNKTPTLWQRLLTSGGLFSSQRSHNSDSTWIGSSGVSVVGVDVSVEFQDAKQGAALLVEQCLRASTSHDQSVQISLHNDDISSMVDYITDVLTYYQNHISQQGALYKVRLVSTVGSKGQKCPRWHVDHVPVRLVMSLAGPGVVYIPYEKEVGQAVGESSGGVLNRDVLNQCEEDDTVRANQLILPQGERGLAVHAQEGDAVLLMGRAWEETQGSGFGSVSRFGYDLDIDKQTSCLAAPHRSPTLGTHDLRVLLVVDYVPEN